MTTEIQFQEWPKCSKCGHANLKIAGHVWLLGSDHAEICEYLTFRGVTARQIGWASIKAEHPRYVQVVFDLCKIEYRSFAVSSIAGNYVEVFAPIKVAALVKMYYSDKSPYGGIDLGEFLKSAGCGSGT